MNLNMSSRKLKEKKHPPKKKKKKNLKLHEQNNEELTSLQEKRTEGVLLRSKARWIAEGEKITKYF